jgi:hypothetical protein
MRDASATTRPVNSDARLATNTSDGRLGLDRRAIGPALLVLALAVLMSLVLPFVDSQTPYHHAVHKGDVVQLADGITLVPTAGWDLASGALVGRARTPVGTTAQTELVRGSVDVYVQAAPFAGSASALLTRVNRINADLNHTRGRASEMTHRYDVTTRQGIAGVAEDFVGVSRQGSVVAFVFRSRTAQGRPTREGVEVIAAGPRGPIALQRDHIVAMIRSIRTAS